MKFQCLFLSRGTASVLLYARSKRQIETGRSFLSMDVHVKKTIIYVGMSLARANGRGFYVGKVRGATQPFTLTADVDV
jgi:hypothetical protein